MLYKLNSDINRSDYSKVKRVNLSNIGWKEKDLENLLSKNIIDFISSDDLMTIFTERPRQEEPDILAVDKNGDLYIFELKRWKSNQENLLQVFRYGQLYGRSDYNHLNESYKKYAKDGRDLKEAHEKYFSLNESQKLSEDMFNMRQHFLIVTNGLDHDTVESIIYWRRNGLDINAIVYWVFEIGGEYYIEFNTYSQAEDYLEYENSCYIVNTNKRYNPNSTKDMLDNSKVAAYSTGYKEKIQKLHKDDIVFLYENGKGIIAYGKADGVVNKANFDGIEYDEYNMHLNDFTILSKPLSAKGIKDVLKYALVFNRTMFSISEENATKIIKYIQKSCI